MEGWSQQAGVQVLSGRKRSAQVGLSASLCHQGAPKGPRGQRGPAGQPSFPVGTEDGGDQECVGSWIHSPRALSDSQYKLYPSPGVMQILS